MVSDIPDHLKLYEQVLAPFRRVELPPYRGYAEPPEPFSACVDNTSQKPLLVTWWRDVSTGDSVVTIRSERIA